METAAGVVRKLTKMQGILKLLTYLQLTAYLWPPEATVKDGAYADFVIIGGGTAGSIIASSLLKYKHVSVIVIEAGGMGEFETQQAGLFPLTKNTEYDWQFKTVENRVIQQGKVLGGSSQVNYMIYGNGYPVDYDEWASITNDSTWSFKNIFPLIKKAEKVTDKTILNSPDVAYHGTEGKIRLKRYHSGQSDAALNAYREMGYNVPNDINPKHEFGFSNAYLAIGQGNRQSTAYSFFSSEKDNPNLKVSYHSVATKIIFDENKRAIAVRVRTKDKKYITINVKKEVIITAGTFKSPQVLMLSGIGPKQHLESKNIKVVSDLPVGQNLQDHPTAVMVYKMGPVQPAPPPNPHEFPVELISGRVAKDKCQKRASYIIHSGVIVSPLFFFTLCSYVFNLRNEVCDRIYKELSGRQIFLLTNGLLYPESRGEVILNSTDPDEKPIIKLGLYSHQRDVERHAEYVQHYYEKVKAHYNKSNGYEFVDPGLEMCKGLKNGTHDYWKCYIRGMSTTLYNYVGTCAMGSVVDSKLRVIGVKGVRVADASVMPKIVGANVEASVNIIAEKLVDILIEKYKPSAY
ncbi:hypothetical protein B5X24_HaOG208793 [Helicoverpa armigera]|uniref:Glucose-methanol-choline oxidoreductase N-terminal domain-containing protein n=1 Tax=Helicoverpa armigera TaxID=29058 RepID=A0A2W1BFD2_HELAM|nr:hypothetical protein B5X24_HaOG208793 [Helicoverpa armigera]